MTYHCQETHTSMPRKQSEIKERKDFYVRDKVSQRSPP